MFGKVLEAKEIFTRICTWEHTKAVIVGSLMGMLSRSRQSRLLSWVFTTLSQPAGIWKLRGNKKKKSPFFFFFFLSLPGCTSFHLLVLLTERPVVCAGRNGIKAGDYNGIFAEVWGKEEKKHKTKKKWRRKLNLPSPKSCWLCVHCRSCGLQQLPFITMQNNPLFVQRNRIAALKKEREKENIVLHYFALSASVRGLEQ